MDDILEMDSIYFLCDVATEVGERNLDEYKVEYDYQVEWLPLDGIISRDESVGEWRNIPWIIRENVVIQIILPQWKV